MIKGRNLINILGRKFPKRIAKKNHDFVGLMAGYIPAEVKKILLCLDYDSGVHEVAKQFKPDLILTHHPFIYGTPKEVFETDPLKKALYIDVVKKGLCIYSMHTNFDEAKDGMNDALSEALGLKEVYAPEAEPCMRIGYLDSEMEIRKFARYACKQLKVNHCGLLPFGKQHIKKVGIVGGGGSYFYPVAIKEGCDVYISGDTPHHVRRAILEYKFSYIDMPHEIEKIFVYQMQKILLNIDPKLEILPVDHEKEIEVII